MSTSIVLSGTFGMFVSVIGYEILNYTSTFSFIIKFIISGIIGSVVSALLYYFVFSKKTTTCTSNSNCSVLTPICENGTCVECAENTDCQSGEICQNNQCVYQPTCSSNSDCSGNTPYCENGTCVECVETSNCPSGQTCVNGTCQACSNNYGSYTSTQQPCTSYCCGLTSPSCLCYADNSGKSPGDTVYTFEPLWFESTNYADYMGYIEPSPSGPWPWKMTGQNGIGMLVECGYNACANSSWDGGWVSQIIFIDKDDPTENKPLEYGHEYWLYDVQKNAFLYYLRDSTNQPSELYGFYPGDYSQDGKDVGSGYSYITIKVNYEGSGSTPQYVSYGDSISLDDTSLTLHSTLYNVNTSCCDQEWCYDVNDPCLSTCYGISNSSTCVGTTCNPWGGTNIQKVTLLVRLPTDEPPCTSTSNF